MKTEHIKSDGTAVELAPKNGKEFTLEEMQAFVGGYIEIVYLDDGRMMILNEEGKLNGLPINDKATALFSPHDEIVGDVLVTDPKYID